MLLELCRLDPFLIFFFHLEIHTKGFSMPCCGLIAHFFLCLDTFPQSHGSLLAELGIKARLILESMVSSSLFLFPHPASQKRLGIQDPAFSWVCNTNHIITCSTDALPTSPWYLSFQDLPAMACCGRLGLSTCRHLISLHCRSEYRKLPIHHWQLGNTGRDPTPSVPGRVTMWHAPHCISGSPARLRPGGPQW